MDITNIKNFFLLNIKPYLNLSLLWSKAKEALKLPYAKTYIAAAFVLFVIFFIFTFPYDMLLRNKLKTLERTVLKNIYVSEINFSLFDIIEMNNIYAILNSGSEVTVRNADIDLSILRLLIAKDIKGTVQFTGFKYNSGGSQVTLNLNGDIFLDYKTRSDIPQGGNFNIIIDNALLKLGDLTLPDSMGGLPLSLPLIKISSIKIDADIAGGKINVRNFRIFGKDLNGTITGTITLQKNVINSPLDLKLVVNADSPVLEGYRDFLSKFTNDRNQVAVQIRGSLMMPRFEASQGESGASPRSDRPEHPIDKIIPVR
jgi:hypothetical protein